MALSAVASVRFKVYGVLLLVNTTVLALSAHINHFQEYFYKADVFPLGMSVVTMAFVLMMIFLDISFKNAVTARPPFELGWLLVFGMLWLGFNAFSTSRWKHVGLGVCRTIPSDAQYAPYRTWCHELQALRTFVWIEWVMFLFTFAYLLRWTISKHNSGRRDVWSKAFSRFSEEEPFPTDFKSQTRRRGETDSEFLQWEKFPQEPSSESLPVSYAQTAQPARSPFERYLAAQHGQIAESQYPQALPNQQRAVEAAPYTQHPRGAVEAAPYTYPQGQYVPPSQAQFTHSTQTYFNTSHAI